MHNGRIDAANYSKTRANKTQISRSLMNIYKFFNFSSVIMKIWYLKATISTPIETKAGNAVIVKLTRIYGDQNPLLLP